MNTPDTPAAVHAAYCASAGLAVNFAIHERAFWDFIQHGFTADDLRCVLNLLKRRNRAMNGAAYSLRLDKLLDFDYRHFDSLLAEARAVERNRVVKTPHQRILEQWRGLPVTDGTGTNAKPIKDVLKDAVNRL